MGNETSTSSTSSTYKMQQVRQNNYNNNSMEYDEVQDQELRSMRRYLKKDQEAFILNNLMLSIQFFENYEREIRHIRSGPVSRKEDDMNIILSQSQKHILLTGLLEEQVSRHVKFIANRLTDCEYTIEPLQPVRMHIILDNVNVNKVSESPNDSTLADPIFYQMRLESSSNRGYVRVRSLETTQSSKKRSIESSETDLPFIAEDDDEVNNESEDVHQSGINPGVQLLSQVEKRANTMVTKSMTDLSNVDRIDGEIALSGIAKTYSQSNLVALEHPEDEGYQESLCNGIPERKLSGPFRQDRQLKVRSQFTHQHHQIQSIESTPRSSRSSGYKSGSSGRTSVTDSDSDYGYGIIANSRSTVMRADLPTSSSEIPVSCFKKFICTRDGQLYSEKSERTGPRNRKNRRMKKAEQGETEEWSYLRSRKFRRYFKELFVSRLAKPLGFEIEDETDVTRHGAIIHCYSMKVVEGEPTLVLPHEIVPSISAKWPESCNGWLEHSRSTILNSSNKDTWLTEEMIDKIEQLGCHIIPESYTPARDVDPFHTVEWQITFPAAERYLETCLSHSQAKVYLMGLMLHKTFIRSTDVNFGLTKSHISSQLFRLLEQNCSASMWAENRAGERLKELMRKLYSVLSQSQPCLADYFIREKNLLANIPRQYLHLVQKQIKRIIDNPVLYLITAMKKIRYKSKFFPVMNYKRLYKLLTIDDRDLVAFIRPDLSRVERNMSQQTQNDESKIHERLGDKVKPVMNPLNGSVHKLSNHKTSIDKSRNTSQELVVEIIDECVELHGLRLTAILTMFIEHFIKIAERCFHYDSVELKDIYLNQAQRLSIILEEQPYGKEEAKKYLNTINTLKHILSGLESQKDGSQTSGKSDHPTISVPLNQYFTDRLDVQGLTSPELDPKETNGSDVQHIPVQNQIIVDSELQEQTML